MDALRFAVQFLTRLPVPLGRAPGNDLLAPAAALFPVVGALIGALVGALYAAVSLLGLPTLPAAILALSAMILLTGALHEDGLADVADGFGGGKNAAQKLEIMRDSRIGSYGVIALMLALFARLIALAGLWDPYYAALVLICAASASRAAMVPVMQLLPPARRDGLAARATPPKAAHTLSASAIACLLTFLLLPPGTAAVALVATALGPLALAWLALRQIGGHTGDVLGAVQQVAEIGFLFAILAMR
ncbi:MAG: adenosylcobinamide-GDP ribazoletransferase [Geminicoccaceae bacterium]